MLLLCSDVLKMALSLLIFFAEILCIIIVSVVGQPHPGNHSDHRITVALSEQFPFVFLDQNETPKGLDVLIIENFAKQLYVQIDYVIFNSSLNYVFANKKHFSAFYVQNNLR